MDRLTLHHIKSHPWTEPIKSFQKNNLPATDEGFAVSTKVSYVGKGGPLYQPGEQLTGGIAVVGNYLKDDYLWNTVRVMGGAYGGFCSFDSDSGFFSFLSYRDPNVESTLRYYDDAAEALKNVDKEALTPAIVGTIGNLDGKVLSPREEGWVSLQRFLVGKTAEGRKAWRDEILAASKSDFEDVVKRLERWSPSVAIVSSDEVLKGQKEKGMAMSIIDLNE